MATVSRTLYRSLLQASRVTPAKRKCIAPPLSLQRAPRRLLSSTTSWRADGARRGSAQSRTPSEIPEDPNDIKLPQVDPSDYMTPSNPIVVEDLNPEERAEYESLSQTDRDSYLGLQNHYAAILEQPEEDTEALTDAINKLDRELEEERPFGPETNVRLKPNEVGFWAEDEPDELGQMEDADDEYDESMITAVAESELELHREIRQYTRIAAWDMPLLSKYAQSFELPATNQVLRFRYTTYMGETHPAEKKVVMEFATKDVQKVADLTEPQRIKLIKLVGVRYNPDTDVVRMSSEKFEYAAQNKRYLGDLVGKLIKEAKDEKDMFEDIPLDFRHHKPKVRHLFPEQWKMSGNRVEELKKLRTPVKHALEPPKPKPRENEGAKRVAEYVAAMPLGRRDAPLTR